jgi:serine phosphatase RsbU (regulator of sigma subunit)
MQHSVQLKAGERVLLFSDGLENTLISHRFPMPRLPVFKDGIAELLRLPRDEVISQLSERLDTTPGGLSHADDVTAILVDIL